jgi:hypothetical protein
MQVSSRGSVASRLSPQAGRAGCKPRSAEPASASPKSALSTRPSRSLQRRYCGHLTRPPGSCSLPEGATTPAPSARALVARGVERSLVDSREGARRGMRAIRRNQGQRDAMEHRCDTYAALRGCGGLPLADTFDRRALSWPHPTARGGRRRLAHVVRRISRPSANRTTASPP